MIEFVATDYGWADFIGLGHKPAKHLPQLGEYPTELAIPDIEPQAAPLLEDLPALQEEVEVDLFDDSVEEGYEEIETAPRRPATAATLLNSAKLRAANKGFDFNLSIEDCAIPDGCPVFGIPFSEYPWTPSLDRIDSNLGYVKGNVRVISWRANWIKSNATAMELRAIADYIDREKA